MIKNYLKPMTDEEFENLKAKHDKGGAFAKQIQVKQECWDSGIEILPTCGHMKVPKYNVEFEILADEKIKKLQDYYPSLEWLAYLEGEVDHDKHHVLVKDIVIPDSQQTTGVNVYNVEYSWNEGRKIIGVIHSHHSMGAFFSGTDDAYINQNHDVSIVVSTSERSPIKGQVRMKTRCGAYILAEDLDFSVKREKVLDEKEFEKEFVSKIVSPVSRTFVRPTVIQKPHHVSGESIVQLPLPGLEEEINIYSKEKEEELREGLSVYYSDEEIDEFIMNGDAEEELDVLTQLAETGIPILLKEDEIVGEDDFTITDEEWEEEGWSTEESNDDTEELGEQTGLHQVSLGIGNTKH